MTDSKENAQNYDHHYENDDLNEVSMYYCGDCRLPVPLRRRDPVLCPHPKRNNPQERCSRTDLHKVQRPGWLFRVAR